MNYIGEFQKDSTILLELLTKDEENQPIATDFSPTATIEHYDRNGLQEVDNVTLETMEDGSRYTKIYQIPLDWMYGDYLITYRVIIEGREYTTQEKFYLSRTEELVQESNELSYEMLELMKSYTPTAPAEETPEEEPITSANEYIMPPEFQIGSSMKVVNNRLIITLNENAVYNNTYQVILGSEITSVDGARLGNTKTLTFTSEYKPLFATPLEVSFILRSIYKYFTPHDVYVSIRDAGQKAMLLLGNVPDANNSRYRDMRETDTALFPTQKFVSYEAARSLMSALVVRILNGTDEGDVGDSTGMMSESGGTVKLGDFTVTDKTLTSSSLTGGSSLKPETPLQKLQALMRETDKELKFWQDSMLGRNRRGYAAPISAQFRTAGGSPTGRDLA